MAEASTGNEFRCKLVNLHFPNRRANRLRGKAMTFGTMPTENHNSRSNRPSLAERVLRALWFVVRTSLLAILLAFEPIASLLLTAVSMLGIATALFLRFSGVLPQFPFWGMLGSSAGALLSLYACRVVISGLTR